MGSVGTRYIYDKIYREEKYGLKSSMLQYLQQRVIFSWVVQREWILMIALAHHLVCLFILRKVKSFAGTMVVRVIE